MYISSMYGQISTIIALKVDVILLLDSKMQPVSINAFCIDNESCSLIFRVIKQSSKGKLLMVKKNLQIYLFVFWNSSRSILEQNRTNTNRKGYEMIYLRKRKTNEQLQNKFIIHFKLHFVPICFLLDIIFLIQTKIFVVVNHIFENSNFSGT